MRSCSGGSADKWQEKNTARIGGARWRARDSRDFFPERFADQLAGLGPCNKGRCLAPRPSIRLNASTHGPLSSLRSDAGCRLLPRGGSKGQFQMPGGGSDRVRGGFGAIGGAPPMIGGGPGAVGGATPTAGGEFGAAGGPTPIIGGTPPETGGAPPTPGVGLGVARGATPTIGGTPPKVRGAPPRVRECPGMVGVPPPAIGGPPPVAGGTGLAGGGVGQDGRDASAAFARHLADATSSVRARARSWRAWSRRSTCRCGRARRGGRRRWRGLARRVRSSRSARRRACSPQTR